MQQVVPGVVPTLSDIRFNAMNLLALREHSAKELKEKLGRKFATVELIDEAIAGLIELNLQSDERFAQAFVAMRQRQGKGPVIIKMELREKGVDPGLIGRFVDDADVLWFELAHDTWRKKFRGTIPADARERAKQMRFLHSRGFSSRHIQAVFTVATSDDW
ncbi:regulatory protein RecX [Cellvibrio fibrivorans]|jgi:regulatory protein|uniref:Regulatory protein RecX n=1 Tax=Cellvibrio fibrivorans TaxID=126350 RepID=A0ABU1UY26_9GAMM|nr:regulatory protein RecX [Cellvibrio fibrivorans]MDR7090099.1 regulatory protein [Cellvibrio fibrivorans]